MDENINKTACYKLLSMAISYPDKEIAEAIVSNWLFENLKKYFADSVSEELINLMERDFSDIEELQVIYTTNFDLKIPLYESHYILKSDKAEDRAKFLLSLEKLYYEEGVELADRDMPDYLPTQLEFAHYLSSEKKTDQLTSFINTHLKNWIPTLNKKVKKENIKFYKHVIQLIENFII